MKKALIIGFIICGVGVLAAEIGLRMLGVVDFPVYETDSSIGYIPKANQSGSFLNRSDWVLNDKSMGVEENWKPNGAKDLLLLGDSIVWGGNPINQPDKLGPQLEEALPDWEVWPVSAGSWSVNNPLVWMNRHPEVMSEIDTLVWVINSGDFAPASQWATDKTHPRKRPSSALVFVLSKYLLPRIGLGEAAIESTGAENALDVSQGKAWSAALRTLDASGTRTIVVLYPDKSELQDEQGYLEFTSKVSQGLPSTIEVVDLSQREDWSENVYRDTIHPTPAGYHQLANFLAQKLQTRP